MHNIRPSHWGVPGIGPLAMWSIPLELGASLPVMERWSILEGVYLEMIAGKCHRQLGEKREKVQRRNGEGKREKGRRVVHRDGLLICKMHSKESCVEFSGVGQLRESLLEILLERGWNFHKHHQNSVFPDHTGPMREREAEEGKAR